uniref:Lipocalin n=1 Tax=Rhipicephalus zambeziensis TaxID=60191 RepID=A0A224YN26_9ACAR
MFTEFIQVEIHSLRVVCVISLFLVSNEANDRLQYDRPTLQNLRDFLNTTRIWVMRRDYSRTYLAKDYLCENYQPTLRRPDYYSLRESYRMSGYWMVVPDLRTDTLGTY